jgi:hypothetical protein
MKNKKIIFTIYWVILLVITVIQALFIFKKINLGGITWLLLTYFSFYFSNIIFWYFFKKDSYFSSLKVFGRVSVLILFYSIFLVLNKIFFLMHYVSAGAAVIVLLLSFKKVFLSRSESEIPVSAVIPNEN